jgi:hypothetical protein
MVCSNDEHYDDCRPLLLWSVAATDTDVMLPITAMTSSSDGRLTLDCPSQLVFTTATGGWIQIACRCQYSQQHQGIWRQITRLLLDKFRFRHTYRYSQIQVYQAIITRHIDRNWWNTSPNTCSHRQVFIIEHHSCFIHNTTFLYTSWYIYSHPQICLNFLFVFAYCAHPWSM